MEVGMQGKLFGALGIKNQCGDNRPIKVFFYFKISLFFA